MLLLKGHLATKSIMSNGSFIFPETFVNHTHASLNQLPDLVWADQEPDDKLNGEEDHDKVVDHLDDQHHRRILNIASRILEICHLDFNIASKVLLYNQLSIIKPILIIDGVYCLC